MSSCGIRLEFHPQKGAGYDGEKRNLALILHAYEPAGERTYGKGSRLNRWDLRPKANCAHIMDAEWTAGWSNGCRWAEILPVLVWLQRQPSSLYSLKPG